MVWAQALPITLLAWARQHIDGLWFTRISLRGGGDRLALAGKVREPEYLPQYLQKLAKEQVFAGQQFDVLRLTKAEQAGAALEFEVSALDTTD